MPQNDEEKFKFNSIEECEDQEQTEEYYKERGWDILKPRQVFDHSKCNHEWAKLKEKDYQCILCGKGHIGDLTLNN